MGRLPIRFNFMTLYESNYVGIVHCYKQNTHPGKLRPMDHTFKMRLGLVRRNNFWSLIASLPRANNTREVV